VNLTLVPDYGAELRVTGYGKDSDPDRNFSQQTHSGDHAGVFGDSELRHRIDTMGGNSGSTIINEATQEIIGIHTHGGCSTAEDSANAGTSLAKNQEFVNAVKACLALTKKEDLQ
jgi:V8-like Glu-specific endopeptidase